MQHYASAVESISTSLHQQHGRIRKGRVSLNFFIKEKVESKDCPALCFVCVLYPGYFAVAHDFFLGGAVRARSSDGHQYILF